MHKPIIFFLISLFIPMQFLANKDFHCLTELLILASLPSFPLPVCTGCGDLLLKLLLVATVSLM